MKDLLVHGRLAPPAPRARVGEHAAARVSSSWELVRRGSEGALEVVTGGAFAYDLADDGTVAWTDGSRIVVRHPDGRSEELVRDHLVHDVAWLA